MIAIALAIVRIGRWSQTCHLTDKKNLAMATRDAEFLPYSSLLLPVRYIFTRGYFLYWIYFVEFLLLKLSPVDYSLGLFISN